MLTSFYLLVLGKLFLAVFLGGIIGLERHILAKKEAGTKTYALVTMGAALYTLLSMNAFGTEVDGSRIASGIVTGIGFLGAGMIITHGEKVEGLTTAAGLWVTAAIGMAVAAGWYAVAIITTLFMAISLALANKTTKI